VQLLNWLVDLDEILYEGDDVEDNIDTMLLNLVASTIPKRRTFKFLRWCKFWNDWWNWMKFCMEVMQIKMTSTSNYLIP
jgi:hypothetical protein